MNQRRTAIGSAIPTLLLGALLLFAVGCHKKAPVPPAPAPPPVVTPAPPPPPPAEKPVINSFTAEPSRIQRGQSTALTWSVGNATQISINEGIGAVQSSGSSRVSPSNSITYTLTATGPGGTDSRSATVDVSAPPPSPPPPVVSSKPSAAQMLASDVHDAYFDYDKHGLRPDAQQALTQDAAALKQIIAAFPAFTVLVEGNCDDRGSAEYNLGLADRRASSAREFLIQLGVPGDRLKTVSYGKERPVCTEQSEECYQRNRHVHFSPTQ